MSLHIGYDSGTKDGDVPCLTVMRYDNAGEKFEVINMFTGAEAKELYQKLGGKNLCLVNMKV